MQLYQLQISLCGNGPEKLHDKYDRVPVSPSIAPEEGSAAFSISELPARAEETSAAFPGGQRIRALFPSSGRSFPVRRLAPGSRKKEGACYPVLLR